MKTLGFILLTVLVSLGTFLVAYKYMPLTWLESGSAKPSFGSTITTINGSDTLSSSRSVINTNFSNLNTDKIEATVTTLNSLTSASSLATIGTITSGIWNGTKITVPFGGTGSTTLSSGQVLTGNGAGNISVVSGYGVSGQFLTSNGTGIAPTWQTAAIDQTASYNWTGTYFGVKNFLASSTVANPLVLNTVSYNTPSTQGAIGSMLLNDGSGNLTWAGSPRYVYSTNSDIGAANAFSSSTALNIPAGFVTASSTIEVTGNTNCSKTSGSASCTFYLRTGTGVTLASWTSTCSTNCNVDSQFTIKITMVNSVSSQIITLLGVSIDNSNTLTNIQNGASDLTGAINMANAFSLVMVDNGPDAATTPKIYSLSMVVNK